MVAIYRSTHSSNVHCPKTGACNFTGLKFRITNLKKFCVFYIPLLNPNSGFCSYTFQTDLFLKLYFFHGQADPTSFSRSNIL